MGAENPGFEQKMDVNDAERFKYLGFIQAAALHAILCFASLYAFAKEKSGPLKPGVESVEGAVKTVVYPVYNKFHDVPIELLKFVDRKMDESMSKLDGRIPPVMKQVSTQAFSAAQKAPEVARGLVSEVQRDGVMGTAKNAYVKYEPVAKDMYSKYEPAAKALYSMYEPVAERYAVLTWQRLNQLPLFPKVAEVVVPTAAYCSEQYNRAVISKAENGYRVANYLPLVPTEKIAKVFSAQNHEAETEIPVS